MDTENDKEQPTLNCLDIYHSTLESSNCSRNQNMKPFLSRNSNNDIYSEISITENANSCTVMADYQLDGLSNTLTSFTSSVDTINQPKFLFAGSGGSGSNQNPTIAKRGLSFAYTINNYNSRYIKISGPWKQNLQNCTGVSFWMFRSYYYTSYFAAIALQSTDPEGRLLYLYDKYGANMFSIVNGTQNFTIGQIKNGWNLMSVEL